MAATSKDDETEKDIVVGVVFFGYVETFTIPSDRSGTVTIICLAFFSYSAPANCQLAIGPEVNWNA